MLIVELTNKQNTILVKMNTVFIIDDDVELTKLLCEYLTQQGFTVSAENNPIEALRTLKSTQADVVLLDIMMPEMDGFEVLKHIRSFSSLPVIMLTAKGDDYDKILGLESGADDYLPKPFNQRELVARIKALIRRSDPAQGFDAPKILKLHNIQLNEGNQSVQVKEQTLELTSTEFMLLSTLMKSAGQLQTKEKLTRTVLGRRISAFDRSIDMHVSNVRKKLAESGVDDVIKTIRGTGYLMKLSN